MPFNHNSWLITQELRQMDRYLDLLSNAVSDNKKQFDATVEEFSKKTTTQSEQDEFSNFVESAYEEIETDFPRLLFSSFVVSWYSFMESRLIDFCKHSKLKISFSIHDIENLPKSVIRRAYRFLFLSANYKINNTHWNELIHIGEVRNKIVHNNGKLPSSIEETKESVTSEMTRHLIGPKRRIYLNLKKELYQHLTEHELIDFYHDGFRITPNLNYCKHLVSFGLEFFDNLYKTFSSNSESG